MPKQSKPLKKIPKEETWKWDEWWQEDRDRWWNELAKSIVKNEDARRHQTAILSPEQRQKMLEQQKVDIAGVWNDMSDYGRSMVPSDLVPTDESLASLLQAEENPFAGSLLEGAMEPAKPKPVERKAKVKGRDQWGFRLGSGAAAINAVLSTTPKTAKQIHAESRCGRSVSGHLAKLIEMGIVQKQSSLGKDDRYFLVDKPKKKAKK